MEARIRAERLPEEAADPISMEEASPPMEPSALEGMRIRRMIQSVDADAINSWHLDMLQLPTEDIIAYLCQMFIQLKLTRIEADPAPSRKLSDDHGELSSAMYHEVSANQTCILMIWTTACTLSDHDMPAELSELCLSRSGIAGLSKLTLSRE